LICLINKGYKTCKAATTRKEAGTSFVASKQKIFESAQSPSKQKIFESASHLGWETTACLKNHGYYIHDGNQIFSRVRLFFFWLEKQA
jgi:hypothetical protein